MLRSLLFIFVTAILGLATVQAQPHSLPLTEPLSLENIDQFTQIAQYGSGKITHMNLSPDGKRLALVGRFGIRIYDLTNPDAEPRVIGTEYGSVFNVLFSPDWAWVAISIVDSLVLIDVETGDHIRDMEDFGTINFLHSTANELTLSHNGRWLAMTRGLDSGHILIWDVQSGELIFFHEHRYMVTSPMFAPDDSTFAYDYREIQPYYDYEIFNVWNIINPATWSFGEIVDERFGVFQSEFQSFDDQLTPFTFKTDEVIASPDGTILVSIDDNGSHLWNVLDGSLLSTLPSNYLFKQFSPDGRLLITTTDNHELILVDPLSKEVSPITTNHNFTIFAFSKDSSTLAAVDTTSQIHIIDLVEGHETTPIDANYLGTINEFALDQTNLRLYFVDNNTNLRCLNMLTDEIVLIDDLSDGIGQIAFSPKQSLIAFGTQSGLIHLYNTQTNEPVTVLFGHEQIITDLVFHPDGVTLASSASDKTVRLWNTVSGESQILARYDRQAVDTLAFSPDGTQLLVGDADNGLGLVLYSIPGSQQITQLSITEAGLVFPTVIDFSLNNSLVATGGIGNRWTWHLKDLFDMEKVQEYNRYGVFENMKLSPIGDLLLTSYSDNYIQVENIVVIDSITTGEPVLQLQDFPDAITTIAISPNRYFVAFGGADGIIRFWGVPSDR